jgi:diguanylate cyclase (GGDEF)-like protein
MAEKKVLINMNFPVAMGIAKYTGEWSLENVNEAFYRMTGCKEQDFAVCKEDQSLFEGVLERTVKENTAEECDLRIVCSGGRQRLVRMKCSLYEKRDEVPYVALVFLDDLDQTKRDAHRNPDADCDPLTNLLTRQQTRQSVEKMIREYPDEEHVMFVIDVDDFEKINTSFGRTYGDTVLVDIAATIREHFRSDDVVGRIDGDEFLVFMRIASREQAVNRAETLCALLEKDYSGQELSRKISVSIGLAFYDKDGADYDSLFEKADHAMCRVKNAGKNGYEIARNSDVGPTRIKKQSVEKKDPLSLEDREFLMYSFGLMAHARNIDGSLNLLLQRIAARFDLELVALFENVTKQTEELTNYYSSCYTLYSKMVFPKTSADWNGKKPGDLIFLDRVKVLNINDLHQDGNAEKKLQEIPCSAVVGTYEYIGDRVGEIYYLSLKPDREWESGELELLKELTRVISVFVSLRFQVDQSQAEVRHIQRRDQLTGLYNYEAFTGRMQKILAKPERGLVYALEYLDINNFGYVNDNYGYRVGDNALKMFASDAKNQSYYRMGCRLYSDFFLILVADESVEAMSKNLTAQHRRFANMQNHQYPSSSLGISAGVFEIDPEHFDMELALENAILAWKAAKTDRRQEVVFFTPELRKKRMDEQQIIGEFFEALYRNEFQMYLQPKFILGERKVYGAEALARWRRPDGKVLAPGAFLEPLETIGYVTELDFYIFEQLLKTMSRWKKQNRPQIIVSTNFSGRHFNQDGQEFLSRINHIVSKYDVSPENIEIEITEGVLVKNASVLKECLNQLREWGFRVAIDDFGTGYSSLSVLTDIPSDVVKMDKSFIDKGLTGVRKDLIAEIGSLIGIVDKDIIFEGIETEEQEQMLMNCGFSHGQGYLCNQPIQPVEFENLYLNE